MHFKFLNSLLLIACLVTNSNGQVCGQKYVYCIMELWQNPELMDLVKTIQETGGNMPRPVEEYRETFCGGSRDAMACAEADGGACYAETLETMNDPSERSTVITGSDGKSIHAIDDCNINN